MSKQLYTHESHDLPGYREASAAYERRLTTLDGPEPLRRAVAYREALDECWESYGEGTEQLAAALYYFSMWLKPLSPWQATRATISLVEAERGFAGLISRDMQGTLVNLALALLANKHDSRIDSSLLGEVASRFAIALSCHLQINPGQAELNLGHALFGQQKYARAAAWLEIGLKRTRDPKRISNALRTRARAYYKVGALDESLIAYKEALRVLRDAAYPTELAVALYQLSELYEKRSNFEAAAAAMIECDEVEERYGLFRDRPKEREVTRKNRRRLKPFARGRSVFAFLDAVQDDPDLDARQQVDLFHQKLYTGHFDEALAIAVKRGVFWVINCEIARQEESFAAPRFERLLELYLKNLGLKHQLLPLSGPSEARSPSGEAAKSAEPARAANTTETANLAELPVNQLLTTALRVQNFLANRLKIHPDRQLAQAYLKLEAQLDPLELPFTPFPGDASIALPEATRTAIEETLKTISIRGQALFKDDAYLRTRLSAGLWLNSLENVEIVDDCPAILELQDLPLDFLRQDLARLDRVPRTRALYLFGNALYSHELAAVDFQDLRELTVVDLSENKLSELPDSLASHPTLEWLSLRNNVELTLDPDTLRLPRLRYLDVQNTLVSDEDRIRLRERFPEAQIFG